MTGYRNIAGTWRPFVPWRNIAGTWKAGLLWLNVAGVWKLVAGLTVTGNKTTMSATGLSSSNSVVFTSSVAGNWTYTVISGTEAPAARFTWSGGTGTTTATYAINTPATGAGSWTYTIRATCTANGVTASADCAVIIEYP